MTSRTTKPMLERYPFKVDKTQLMSNGPTTQDLIDRRNELVDATMKKQAETLCSVKKIFLDLESNGLVNLHAGTIESRCNRLELARLFLELNISV